MSNGKLDAPMGEFPGGEPFPRPPQLKDHHRAKLAVIYVRTAALGRGAEATLASQRALAIPPRLWGWPASRIRIIDDSGLPGTAGASRRGFQDLRALIRRRQVGLVLVRDVSRLSRDPVELATFLREATQRGVAVLAAEFVVHDLTAWRHSVIAGGARSRG
jgi:DNA invertase Pin-like site-specific DNA recombinase